LPTNLVCLVAARELLAEFMYFGALVPEDSSLAKNMIFSKLEMLDL